MSGLRGTREQWLNTAMGLCFGREACGGAGRRWELVWLEVEIVRNYEVVDVGVQTEDTWEGTAEQWEAWTAALREWEGAMAVWALEGADNALEAEGQ